MARAVVLVSGGLDSATVLAIAQADGWTCHALSIDYGQRHRAELAAAAYLDGRVVTIEAAGTEYTGVVLGTSARGGLRLRGPDGELPEILSGNVRVRRIEPPG